MRWQDDVAEADAAWTRAGIRARPRRRSSGCSDSLPESHAAAGWQINAHGLELEREYGLRLRERHARRPGRSCPRSRAARARCPQLPTTLPTFDELLGRDGIDESHIGARAVRSLSCRRRSRPLQVFTLHAELEGMLLRDAFESLLVKWREAGAVLARMATLHDLAIRRALPVREVVLGTVPGRSGLLAVQAAEAAGS